MSWPQITDAVSVLAASDPRMGSPILLLGPGHTSTAVRETQIVGEQKSEGTCSSKGLSGVLCFESRG